MNKKILYKMQIHNGFSKSVYFMYGILTMLLIYSCTNPGWEQTPVNEINFEGINNLKLNAIVSDVDRLPNCRFHGHGIVYLSIINSNIDYYDKSDELGRYFVKIKGNNAELYTYVGSKSIGDTIKIDMENEKQLWYHDISDHRVWNYTPKIYSKGLYECIERNNAGKL